MKYYTPTPEEFHIGFEYENKLVDGYWQWHGETEKVVFTKGTNLEGIIDYPNLVRVKHLDREDIESFGFIKRKNDYLLQGRCSLMISNSKITITKNSGILFWGTIKNKSELKRILTQIGVV